jgi:hypothetical protein
MKYALILILLAASAFAQVTVEKILDNPNPEVGSEVRVLLHINNTLGKVPARLVSQDILGGSGFDIQCYEFTLPAGDNTIELVSLNPAFPGEYTLSKAQITYQSNGREEIVESNELEVKVAGKEPAVRQESVTTIYQCGGQNMQYTQTSSQQSGEQQSSQQNGQQQSSQQDMDNRMQANQMNQDSSALKEQMQKEQQAKEQLNQQFEQQISKNKELQQKAREMIEQGFKPKAKQIDAESNDTGEFKYDFSNGTSTQSLSGKMQDGNMTSLKSSLDEERLKQLLSQDPKFKQYAEQLMREGYNMTAFDYKQQGNETDTKTSFQDPAGQTANISAEVTNSTVSNVKLEQQRKRWYLWLIPLAVLIVAASVLLIRRKAVPAVIAEKPFDYRAEAGRLLDESKQSFEDRRYKDAYGKAGEAVRLFYSWDLGICKELTSTETINLMKKQKKPYKDLQNALNLCGMVEFAKYEPNSKDFDEIISVAEKAIT